MALQGFLETLARVTNAILNSINISKKKAAADDPADTIANGGRVRESDVKFSDLADESERDKAE